MTTKIGFLVEGDVDKAVVEALASRILGPSFRPYAVRLGGEVALPWAYATVLSLLEEKHYPHVVLVLDADSTNPNEVERRQQTLQGSLARHHLGANEVTVCLAVPSIEAWLLAGQRADPERVLQPKEELRRLLGKLPLSVERATDLANALDLAIARQRAPSLDRFGATLERLATALRSGHAA